MNALVLANGELYETEILRERIQDEVFDLVIGVDGGSRYASELNITVDVIIGDMDSFPSHKHLGNKNTRFISYPEEKNETDLELALLYTTEQGVDKIVVVGAMGGRMDMTISNIQLIAHASSGSCRIEIWHGEQTGWFIQPPGEDIHRNPGDTISLIPIGGYASGITTKGMKYPLNNEELTMKSRGVSNRIESPPAHVTFRDGQLLVVHTPGNAPERQGR
ncbi:MAG: thiamine diphosphokinase [Dehalococcoidales bacterium]|nr:thiamine diphosphokinase [Dehalococcoidales bacterium]